MDARRGADGGASVKKSVSHPRVAVSSEKEWGEIYNRLQADEQGRDIYNKLIASADEAAEAELYTELSTGSEKEANERSIGDRIRLLAGAYKLSGDVKYLNRAKEWAEVVCGLSKYGNGYQLAAGHILKGMGCLYDWCYNDLSDDFKLKMRTSMVEKGALLYRAGLVGEASQATWAYEYLSNVNFIANSGLITAGVALYDDDETGAAYDWINLALKDSAITLSVLGNEGITHEGVGYWAYGTSHFLDTMAVMSDFFGINVWKSEWLKNTAYYRIQASHPYGVWGTAWHDNSLYFGDAHGYDFSPLQGIMYQLAARYNDGKAQWTANCFNNAGIHGTQQAGSFLTSAIYYNKDIQTISAEQYSTPTAGFEALGIPATEYFEDAGVVVSRSGWENDASMIAFKCGQFAGKAAAERKLSVSGADKCIGAAHSHPDQNHFYIIANGEVVLKDDGYTNKTTKGHNTLLVDNSGQLGVTEDGDAWTRVTGELSYANLSIRKFESNDVYDYWVGDATQSYSSELGLKRYARHMIHLKDKDALLIIDDIRVDEAKPLELRFFPNAKATVTKISDTEFKSTIRKVDAYFKELTPDNTAMSYDTVELWGDYSTGESSVVTKQALTVKTSSETSWLNAMAVTWGYNEKSASPKEAASVTCKKDGDSFVFEVDDSEIIFNPYYMELTVK